MNRCLILYVLAIAASANAAPEIAPRPAQVAEAKPVSTQGTGQTQQPAPPRQLSEQERAELRRQLQQFNQQFIRRP